MPKRIWSDVEREEWRAEELQKGAAQKALVQSIAAGWHNNQSQTFKKDFLGTYACKDVEAANAIRSQLGVEIKSDVSAPGKTPAPIQTWAEMRDLPLWIERACLDQNWEAPMPVQAQAFPILLGGRNLIGIAQTGSGKTIAFMLPAVIHAHDQKPLSRSDKGPIVLVLAPTRELAVQIAEETEKLTKYSSESRSYPSHGPNGLRTACFYGGANKREQLQKYSAEGSHFLVATPGRLLDCIAEGSVTLRRVTFFCLDEADRMLDLGFLGDMEQLSTTIRPDKQMAFFSATWPKDVEALAYNLCTSGQPVTIRVSQAGKDDVEALQAREGIHQDVIMIEEVEGRDKWGRQDEIKKKLLDVHIKQALAANAGAKILIFVNQKTFADELAEKLWNDNVRADAIHGGRQQDRRLSVLDDFRQGKTQVLIATDVVGRGLDIPNVTHVVVYSMNSAADYIHRIGRTGRGKCGTGHALVLFEYMAKQSELAGQLVEILKRSMQVVPPELQQVADEVKSGKREDFYSSWQHGGSRYKSGGSDWKSGGDDWKKDSKWNNNGDADWKTKGDWKSGGWKSDESQENTNTASWKSDDSKQNTSMEQPLAFIPEAPGLQSFLKPQPQAPLAYPPVQQPDYPPAQPATHASALHALLGYPPAHPAAYPQAQLQMSQAQTFQSPGFAQAFQPQIFQPQMQSQPQVMHHGRYSL